MFASDRLQKPVGPGMPDLPADLRIVQRWLEPWLRILGGSGVPTMYQSARDIHDLLNRFQQQVMREPFPSGSVIPGDRTERKLKERPPLMQPRIPIRPPWGMLPHVLIPGTPLQLPPRTGFKLLSDEDYEAAAQSLECESLMLRAFSKVEGRGRGFDHFDRPVILYEPTHFATLSLRSRQYGREFPELTHKGHKSHLYGTDNLQWQHLQAAYLLNPRAALQATSWGQFQQVGEFCKDAGFATVEQMVIAMCESEQVQLKAFVVRIQRTGLTDALARKDWTALAAGYNGKRYKDYEYDTKLEQAYEALKTGSGR